MKRIFQFQFHGALRLWAVIYLVLKMEIKKSLCSFFLTVFSMLKYSVESVFIFSVVFSWWSFSLIQRNMCFHGMFVYSGGIVSNSLLFCTFELELFLVKYISNCGYLHRNFSNLLYFIAYFLQIFNYSISLVHVLYRNSFKYI